MRLAFTLATRARADGLYLDPASSAHTGGRPGTVMRRRDGGMSLSAQEQQNLDSIKDRLAGSDPRLARF
jgi:hypothetical protein